MSEREKTIIDRRDVMHILISLDDDYDVPQSYIQTMADEIMALLPEKAESPASPEVDWEKLAASRIIALNKIDHLLRPHRFSPLPDDVKWQIYTIAADEPRVPVEAERLTLTASDERVK